MRQRYEIPEPGQPFDPAIFRLGSPCKRNHLWDEGVTLRLIKNRKCPLCDRIDSLERQTKRRNDDPETFKATAALYMRRRRAKHGRGSRSKHGLPYTPRPDLETRMMLAAIRRAGRLPSVARLVYDQQLEHWRAHPDLHTEFNRQRVLLRFRWRYMTDVTFRLYHGSKASQRKARLRGSCAVTVSPDQLWRRWVEFDHCCAYCGTQGDLQVEHVIPISKGGEHHLGNIVPACATCNYSKRSAPVEQWYKAQPFFAETRWLAIQAALAKGQPMTEQLAMRLCA